MSFSVLIVGVNNEYTLDTPICFLFFLSIGLLYCIWSLAVRNLSQNSWCQGVWLYPGIGYVEACALCWISKVEKYHQHTIVSLQPIIVLTADTHSSQNTQTLTVPWMDVATVQPTIFRSTFLIKIEVCLASGYWQVRPPKALGQL